MSAPNAKDPLTGQFTSELLRGKPNPHKVSGPGFQPGNPGRPVGSRNKLGEAFYKAMFADFEAHGVEAIAKVREEDPSTYVRVVAGLMPKEITGADGAPILTGITVTFVKPDASE